MAKTSSHITVEPNLKNEATLLFQKLGLDFSTAITLFLSQAVREQRIPFEIKLNTYNEETIQALKESNEISKNPENYKTYSSFEDVLRDLED